MTRLEHKTIRFELKSLDEQGHITAYGSVFDNVDEGGDRMKKGAFTRTLKNSKSRADAQGKKFLIPMLWQHDTNQPIGGWYDLKEDDHGLLCKGQIILETQRGREAYALLKERVIDEFSIIYDVPQGGAHYDSKSGVRELTEVRLFSVDPVTFAMNEEALLVGVKGLEYKAICGNTSGSIGPRDEAWDGAKAQKQIWAVASNEESGTITTATAKKYFMVCEGDGSKKGDYSYPFWYVGDDPHICVGAVKAIAGAIQGSRGANAPDGLKSKVETLYKRINKKYPDDPELIPPWDGKARKRPMQQKTFTDHFNQELACDLLRDWQDVFVDALTCAVFDAFTIGDQPAQDVSEALDAFKETVLSKFVAMALECDLSQYLADHALSYTPGLGAMQSGSGDDYSYMSRSTRLYQKAGRALSAAHQATIDEHVKAMKSMARKAKSAMKAHTNSMHEAINEMAGMDNDDAKARGGFATKAGRAISAANAKAMHEMADKAMDIMAEHTKALHDSAGGLADTVRPGPNPDYDEDEDVTDATKSARSRTHAPRPYPRPLTESTADEHEAIPASFVSELRLLRTT